jgi:LCP family protein required for cell wall assembly
VLLIGTDSRDETSLSGNADTIMLVHVPADRSGLYLVSFTRDMHVPIPGLGEGKINAAFSRGGTDTLAATVSELLGGVEVDLAMQTNFNGFINLTRALDGIEVDNKHHSTVTVSSTGRVVDFPEGRITLENTDGLIYVRERKRLPLGDLDRTERQRATVIGMLDGIAEHADDPVFLAELVALLHGNVKVTGDLDLADFVDMVPLAAELDRDDVVGLMVPITGFGTVDGASVNLVDEAQTAALGEALRSDTMDAYVEEYGTDYAP